MMLAIHLNPIVRAVLTWTLLALVGGWIVFETVRKAEDPARMLFKWVLTALTLAFMLLKVAPMMNTAPGSALVFIGFCGIVMTITWRYQIGALVARPFASLYDGGSTEPDPHPFYSVALAKRKKGLYLESIAEVRKQLERFPTDLEGQLLLAEIQAEDLKDLDAAKLTIHQLVTQPGHAPKNIVFALYSLADWQLRFAHDREAARQALEEVITLLPDTEFSLGAAQRIAHLATAEAVLSPLERQKFTVHEGNQRLGLAKQFPAIGPAEQDPAEAAAAYVKHLEQYPQDTDAREHLATIYADHYARLDLATSELEQMIQQPNQPSRLVARWLNHLADLQVRCGADYDSIRQTLQRIIDLDPKLAAAENARKRIDLLRLEMKGKQQNQAVKMGTYEQNLGLKRERAPRQGT